MRAKLRKLQTEITELKVSGGERKTLLKGLRSKVTVAEDKISEPQDEMQKTA